MLGRYYYRKPERQLNRRILAGQSHCIMLNAFVYTVPLLSIRPAWDGLRFTGARKGSLISVAECGLRIATHNAVDFFLTEFDATAGLLRHGLP